MECIAYVLDKPLLYISKSIVTFITAVCRFTATAADSDYGNVTCNGIGTILIGLAYKRLRNDMIGQVGTHEIACAYPAVVLLNVFGVGR